MPELPRRRTASAEGGVSLSDHSHRDSDSDGSFQWLFPRHIDLYHELWQLEDDGFYLDDDPLKISASARDAYGAYALGAFYHRTSDAAVAGASADANNPDAAIRAAPRAREFHARTTPIGPAPPGPAPPSRQVSLLDLHPADRVPLESVDHANARVPPVTVRRFWSTVGDPEFNLREMGQFQLHPPTHPSKARPFSKDTWDDMRLDCWSPTEFGTEQGVTDAACVNKGLDHARHAKVLDTWR